VATPIPLFVSFEMVFVDTLGWLGFLATVWPCALVALLWIETVIYLAAELALAMKPRAGANEDVPSKPFWAIVATGGTVIRSDVIIAVGTFRGYSDFDADLSLRSGGACYKATPSKSSDHQES
jgi:hypothetical protein